MLVKSSLLRCLLLLTTTAAILCPVKAQTLRTALGANAPKSGLNVPSDLLITPDRSVDFIVAVVNNEPITNHEVRLTVQRVKEQLAGQGQGNDDGRLPNEALELLIYERSQLQWAQEQKINISSEEVNAIAESVAERNHMSLEALYRALDGQGVDKKQFLKNLRERQILQRLRDREIPSRIKITELEVDRFLEQQKANVSQRDQLELAQILIPMPENASPEQVAEAEQKARDWRTEIERGADFFDLARQRSGAADRTQGGRMGLRPADRYPELFIQAISNTAQGGTVGPIRSGAGIHLLHVVQRQKANALTLPQTRARHILLKPGGTLSPEVARLQLLGYKQQIERGQASFEQLAKQHSQDASAADGGDLGWASPGQFVPEFEEVMNTLRQGQISDPLSSRFGVHLIQVVGRRELPMTPIQEREYARNALREAKYDEALDTWAREIRGKAFIEYREPPQ